MYGTGYGAYPLQQQPYPPHSGSLGLGPPPPMYCSGLSPTLGVPGYPPGTPYGASLPPLYPGHMPGGPAYYSGSPPMGMGYMGAPPGSYGYPPPPGSAGSVSVMTTNPMSSAYPPTYYREK